MSDQERPMTLRAGDAGPAVGMALQAVDSSIESRFDAARKIRAKLGALNVEREGLEKAIMRDRADAQAADSSFGAMCIERRSKVAAILVAEDRLVAAQRLTAYGEAKLEASMAEKQLDAAKAALADFDALHDGGPLQQTQTAAHQRWEAANERLRDLEAEFSLLAVKSRAYCDIP